MSYELIREIYQEIAELRRQFHSIFQIGIVSAVSDDFMGARVKIGAIETAFLPYTVARASDASRDIWPLKIGEQVQILAPGDVNAGTIIGVIPTKKHSPKSPNRLIEFAPGVSVEYVEADGSLKVKTTGPLTIDSTAAVAMTAANLKIVGPCEINGPLNVTGPVAAPSVATSGLSAAPGSTLKIGVISGSIEVSGDIKAGGRSFAAHVHHYDGDKPTSSPIG